MGSVLPAPAPTLPVPIDEMKAMLRIGTSEEDALLAGMIRSAADLCERFIGRLLIVREVDEVLPAAAAWTRLGATPVRSIDTLAALSTAGEAEILPAGDYAIDIDAAGDGWVRLTARRDGGRIRVRYVAGLATDANGVPEAVRQGIARLAGHFYSQRGAGESAAPPAAVTALWRPWRRLRLAEGAHV